MVAEHERVMSIMRSFIVEIKHMYDRKDLREWSDFFDIIALKVNNDPSQFKIYTDFVKAIVRQMDQCKSDCFDRAINAVTIVCKCNDQPFYFEEIEAEA